MSEIVNTIAEIACSEVISNVIETVSVKTKIPPFHLVSHIDGLAHSHPPCDYKVDSCSYCKRNGNVFSENSECHSGKDIISKYKLRVEPILKELHEEINNLIMNVISKKVSSDEQEDSEDEDDIEKMLARAFGISDN